MAVALDLRLGFGEPDAAIAVVVVDRVFLVFGRRFVEVDGVGFSPTIVWFMPKFVTCAAECQVVPLVSSLRSTRTTSLQPSWVRW